MKQHKWILTLFTALILLLSACSDSEDASKETSNAKKSEKNTSEEKTEDLYHEIGETFEIEESLTNTPLEIKVKKIWMEDGNKHKKYIEDVEENDTVTFINYTVKNKGDDTVTLADAIPKYFGTDATLDEIDLSYPNNDIAKEYHDAFKAEIEPGETLDLTGSAMTSIYSENNGAFVWEFMEDIPEVVFQTPISERNDGPGVYELGKPIHVIDETEDHQLQATINKVKVEEKTDFESKFDNGEWIVIDMDIENKGKKEKSITDAFPSAVVDDKELIHSHQFKKDGKAIENLHDDEEATIKSGEKVTGTLYINVEENKAKKAQLYYFDSSFLTYPDYSQKVDYNLK